MRSIILILLAVAVIGQILVVTSCKANEYDELNVSQEIAKKQGNGSRIKEFIRDFKLPKIFDFNTYKQAYRKKYPSPTEDSVRSKNYFGRAFKVFISGLRYAWNRSSKYLAINEKSDWTEQERRAIHTYPIKETTMYKFEQRQQQHELGHDDVIVNSSDEDEGDYAVELEEVEETLGEIIARQEESPEYAKIAAELVSSSGTEKLNDLLMKDGRSVGSTNSILETTDDLESLEDENREHIDDESSENGIHDYGGRGRGRIIIQEHPKIDRTRMYAHKGKKYLKKVLKTMLHPAINNPLTDLIVARNRDHANASLPDEVFLDYRESGCFLKPKNQRGCGSCYIFSTTSLYEYHQCKQSGQLVPFSEQYILDCGGRANLDGCNGGREPHVSGFIDRFGLEQQSDYPYMAKEEECPYSPDLPQRFMGHTRADESRIKLLDTIRDREKVAEALEEYGPLVIVIVVKDEFSDYGGGVDRLEHCNWTSAHSVVIVGHGRQDGLDYWLIRNSYGENWGEKGYYKLSKGVPTRCFLQVGYIDQNKFNQNDAHKKQILHNKQRIKQYLELFGV